MNLLNNNKQLKFLAEFPLGIHFVGIARGRRWEILVFITIGKSFMGGFGDIGSCNCAIDFIPIRLKQKCSPLYPEPC